MGKTAFLKIKSSKYTAMITIVVSLGAIAQPVLNNANKQVFAGNNDSMYTVQGIVEQIDLIASTLMLETNKTSISLYADSATKIDPNIDFSDLEVNESILVTFVLMDNEYVARTITCVNRQVSPLKSITKRPESNTIVQKNNNKTEKEHKNHE